MDIVRSLELESFILTKLTKPFVPFNLVGPQVILPLRWVPASRGVFIFLCVIRRHFLACKDIAGGSDLSAGGTFFREIQKPIPRTVRNKEELSLRATMDLMGPSRQALHVQSSSDDSRMLTTPRRAHRGGGRR